MNIFKGKKIHSYNWKQFPITEELIKQVDKLYGDEGWPIMGDGYPLFEWSPGIELNETMKMMNNKMSWSVKRFQFNMKTTL